MFKVNRCLTCLCLLGKNYFTVDAQLCDSTNNPYDCGGVGKFCCCDGEDGSGLTWQTCKDQSHTTLGIYSCWGDRACKGCDNSIIGNGACQGDHSCYHAADSSFGESSCKGVHACTNSENLSVLANSCVGAFVCFTFDTDNSIRSTIGTESCKGDHACYYPSGTIGNNSCNGDNACYNEYMYGQYGRSVLKYIGNNSCNGEKACANGIGSVQIGSNSCNAKYICDDCTAGAVIPNNACNSWEGDDVWYDSGCKFCHVSLFLQYLLNLVRVLCIFYAHQLSLKMSISQHMKSLKPNVDDDKQQPMWDDVVLQDDYFHLVLPLDYFITNGSSSLTDNQVSSSSQEQYSPFTMGWAIAVGAALMIATIYSKRHRQVQLDQYCKIDVNYDNNKTAFSGSK